MLSKLATLHAVGKLLATWWSTSADYEARSGYFAERGLRDGVQLLVGSCTALLALIPVIIQFSPAGPATEASRLMSCGFSASATVWALTWWFGPWPTHRRSIAFIVYADVGITTVALMDSNRLAGLFGINALALVSIYVIFFDGPKILVLHTVWMLITVGMFGVEIGTGLRGDPYLAVAKAIAAIASLVITPAAIHFGIWVLRSDATDSMTDPLTGLLNRRGLHLQVANLLRADANTDADTLMAIVIDLDRFKHINDTYGHAVGDEVLAYCASRIRNAVRAGALVARIGGEEFVVLDVAAARNIPLIAERIRSAIAKPTDHGPITASLGVATIGCPAINRPPLDLRTQLDTVITQADHAMFRSKHAGGNTTTYAAP